MMRGVDLDTSGCCGVNEVYNFTDEGDVYWDPEHCEIRGNSFQELLANLQNNVEEGLVLHIWFKKSPKFNGDFTGQKWHWDGLRKLVRQIPDVKHIARTINPNSKNMIDGYAWVNKKGKV